LCGRIRRRDELRFSFARARQPRLSQRVGNRALVAREFSNIFQQRFLGTLLCRFAFSYDEIGNAPGNYIPNAPAMVASAGIKLGEKTGPFGALRWRYLASSPLTEDNAFRSPATSIFNGRVGYRYHNGSRIQLDVLDLFNTKANQIT
jgi:hypothetical protein